MARWWDGFNASELNAIGSALEVLHNVGFFEKRIADEMQNMIQQEVGANEEQLANIVRTYRINVTLLKRLDSEAVDLVKAMNSDREEN